MPPFNEALPDQRARDLDEFGVSHKRRMLSVTVVSYLFTPRRPILRLEKNVHAKANHHHGNRSYDEALAHRRSVSGSARKGQHEETSLSLILTFSPGEKGQPADSSLAIRPRRVAESASC